MSVPTQAIPLLLAALTLLAATCEQEANEMREVTHGEQFEMAVGDSVRVMAHADFGGVLVFESVSGDSRCPRGVECVWEGEAKVAMTFYYVDETVHPIELTIPGMREAGLSPDEAEQALAGAFLFQLLRLDPYPEADQPAPNDPTATVYYTLMLR